MFVGAGPSHLDEDRCDAKARRPGAELSQAVVGGTLSPSQSYDMARPSRIVFPGNE